MRDNKSTQGHKRASCSRRAQSLILFMGISAFGFKKETSGFSVCYGNLACQTYHCPVGFQYTLSLPESEAYVDPDHVGVYVGKLWRFVGWVASPSWKVFALCSSVESLVSVLVGRVVLMSTW